MTIEALRQAIEKVRCELAGNIGRLASANAELIELVGTDNPEKVEVELRKMEAEMEKKAKAISAEITALHKEIASIQRKLSERSPE